MSIVYGGAEGFAAILTEDEWMEVWNGHHGEERVSDGSTDAFEMGEGEVWDDTCTTSFRWYGSSEPGMFEDIPGGFGAAIDANPDSYNPFDAPLIVFWAPKPPDYFRAVYSDLDALVDDIIASCETFDNFPSAHEFVRDHLVWLNVVSYG